EPASAQPNASQSDENPSIGNMNPGSMRCPDTSATNNASKDTNSNPGSERSLCQETNKAGTIRNHHGNQKTSDCTPGWALMKTNQFSGTSDSSPDSQDNDAGDTDREGSTSHVRGNRISNRNTVSTS